MMIDVWSIDVVSKEPEAGERSRRSRMRILLLLMEAQCNTASPKDDCDDYCSFLFPHFQFAVESWSHCFCNLKIAVKALPELRLVIELPFHLLLNCSIWFGWWVFILK